MRKVAVIAAAATAAIGVLVPSVAGAENPGGSGGHASPGAIVGSYKGQDVQCDPPTSPFGQGAIIYERPGVTVRKFTRTTGTAMYAVKATVYGTPRVRPGPLLRGPITFLEALRDKFSTSGAFAAVNGDFFDWGKTWASLGPEVLRGGRAIKGLSTRQNAMIRGRDGRVATGQVWLTTGISPGKSWVHAESYNTDFLASNGITLFDKYWGAASRKWLAPSQSPVHEAIVANGRVIAESNRLTDKPVPPGGYAIVGQGSGARSLDAAGLHVGGPITVDIQLHSTSATGVDSAIGVGLGLIHKGSYLGPACVADRPLARTLVGVANGGKMLVMVTCEGSIDGGKKGRQGLSLRGASAVMKSMGATDAAMFDGGGSTSMEVARDWGVGQPTVPADGVDRRIPEGYAVWPK